MRSKADVRGAYQQALNFQQNLVRFTGGMLRLETLFLESHSGFCYADSMTINTISAIECLVEDYGWESVMDGLMEMAAASPDERLDELETLLDAAIAVNEGKGRLIVL